MLTLPEGTKVFVVYCDLSQVGLGCLIMQHGKVMAYVCSHLKIHEPYYPTHDLELAVGVFSFKICRYYLYRVHVDVFTNHKSLQYVLTQNELNLRQRRWLELFKGYYMSVLYCPDKANMVLDTLSHMTMGSGSHIDETKKNILKEFHRFLRLWVRFECSPNGGTIFHHSTE